MNSSQQAWMWKRHAGMDVVTYGGDGTTGRSRQHSLGKVPEMIWIKGRFAENWLAWHYGLNGGTDSWQYALELNNTQAEVAYGYQTAAPTATNFFVGTHGMVNSNNINYNAYLFASVDGISKCGRYTGAGSNTQTITPGFTPRFIIIKSASDSWGWAVFDSVRGLTSGSNDPVLYLNNTSAQASGNNYIPTVSSTGFTVMPNANLINQNGDNYIYYAHA